MGRAGERGRWGPFCLYGLRSSELHSLPLGAAAQPGRCITGGQGPSEGASKIGRPSMDEVACNGDELLTREQEKSKEGRREGNSEQLQSLYTTPRICTHLSQWPRQPLPASSLLLPVLFIQ